jgi:uncharacterized LabA/DUF88 family protein
MDGFFIDGNHAFNMSKHLGINLDYKDLKAYIEKCFGVNSLRHYYYNILITDESEVTPLKRLTDFLSHHGYTTRYDVVTRSQSRQSKFTQINIAVDALTLASVAFPMERAIFWIEDAELVTLLCALKNKGVEIVLLYHDDYPISNILKQTADVTHNMKQFMSTMSLSHRQTAVGV